MPHPPERAIRVKKKQEWLYEYKESTPCAHCGGYFHHSAMDLHHTDPNEKEWNITRMVRSDFSMKRIKTESEKCVVLCSNCHRVHHWKEHYPL